MKIVFATGIYPPEIGGPAGYVKGVATELAKQGHEVAVVTYGDDPELNDKFRIVGVPRTSYVVQRYWRYFRKTLKLAKEADIIYAQGPVSEGLPAALASIFARKPLILKVVGDYAWEQYQQRPTSHVSRRTSAEALVAVDERRETSDERRGVELLDEFVTHRHKGKIWLMEAVERWVASRAKQIIVPSKYLKTIVEKWGVEADKIKVIYNSISPLPEISLNIPTASSERVSTAKTSNSIATPLSPPKADPPLAEKGDNHVLRDLGDLSDERRKFVLTAVRAVPWKGGDFLCDVIKDLPAEYTLVVAGDGPELENWKKYAQEIGVADRVMWLGRLSRAELTEWYHKAHLFVLATGYEGFPHVVVEAVSTGLPCIVSDKGGNPEIAELFPGLVTVAPYRNKDTWVDLVRNTKYEIRNTNIGLPESLGFGRMVGETLNIISSLVPRPTSHVVEPQHLRSNLHDYPSNSTQENSIEAKSLDSQILRFSDSQVSERQRVLSIGLEKKLFEEGKVRDRIVEQLKDFDATIIVFAKQKFDEQIAPNVRVISTNSWNKYFYVTDALRLAWGLRKNKFSIVISQDPAEMGLVAYIISRVFKIALGIQDVGYTFHGDYYAKESFLNRIRYKFACWVIHRADAVRVMSLRSENFLVSLGIPREKIIRFPFTVDKQFYEADPQDSTEQEKHLHGKPYFLMPARFTAIKRIDLALDAFSRITLNNPDVMLVLLGKGELESEIRNKITEYNLNDRVLILPWAEKISSWYVNALATLITSDREGYCMTALESLVCSTPVIMTDVGCAHEVVKNGENGIIVPVGDVIALANAMEQILQLPITNYQLPMLEAYGINSTTDSAVRGSGLELRFAVRSSMFASEANMKDFLLSAISYQLSAKKKLEEEMGRFEEEGNDVKQLRLLFVTQVVDKKDPILGFVVRWLQEFVNQNVQMTVFTRKMVYEDLPEGAVGQDLGQPIIARVLKLWYYSVKYRKQYNKVFVHMTPQIVVMGWPVWFILRKPVYMWYMHKSVTWWLKTALWITKKTFTASDLSLRVNSPKKTIVGHGIDTNQFKPLEITRKTEVLWISRIQPNKKLEESLAFMAEFANLYPNIAWTMQIIGSAEGHEEYLSQMRQEAQNLGIAERVFFAGQKQHDELPVFFAQSAVFISTSETGSIDKVVLESLSCGTPVIAKGAEYHELPSVIKLQDKETAMQALHQILTNPQTNDSARRGVVVVHDLRRLVGVLVAQINN